MNRPIRTFTDAIAKRERVPLLIGLVGPSGGGKTGSALELSHGIQDIAGGDIGAIDTEARRMLHYAQSPAFSDPKRRFSFNHLSFGAPFSPMDYWSAIEHFIKKGVRTIIVDSMSHEHEGQGGMLEMHESEMNRLAGLWGVSPSKTTMAAWSVPKSERRKLINNILQQNINFIFCFRAKEKIKIVTGRDPVQLGWQPIAGEEFVFEMTLNCLLPPGANGVPEWSPEEKAERQMIKLPQQFRSILTPGRPLSIDVGRDLAKWAEGTVDQPKTQQQPVVQNVNQTSTEPTPEVQRMAEVQDLIDKYRDKLNPEGVTISETAIKSKDHASVEKCLRSIKKVVEGFKQPDIF